MGMKAVIVHVCAVLFFLGTLVGGARMRSNTIASGNGDRWASCFEDEVFSKHAKLCGVSGIGVCGCYKEMACCVNITTTIPTLPSTTRKLSCRNFNGSTLEKTVFAAITSLKLTYLSIKGPKLRYINNDIFTGFNDTTSLEELDFSGNKLEELPTLCSKSHSKMFLGLRRLSFHKNVLGSVNSSTLNCFGNLTSLNLGKNRIKELDFRVFAGLSNIVNLDIHSNWISNLSNVQHVPGSLQYLNLSKNELNLFSPRLCGPDEAKVDSFPNLLHLNLAENLITIPWNASWDCMGKLRILNLTSNPIRRLLDNTFANLTSLEELLVSDVFTSIDQVQAGAFNNTNLRVLNISNNHMNFKEKKTIRGIFKNIPNVRELDVSGNIFETLESDVAKILGPMRYLERLYLKKCRLQTLPADLLQTFHHLKLLNMDSNEIKSRRIDFIYKDSKLEYLYLAKNQIHTLDPSWFAGHMQVTLKQIDLSNNPFDCACDDKSTRKLRKNINEINENNRIKAYFGNISIMNWPGGYVCDSPTSRVGLQFRDFHPDKACQELDFMTYAFIIIGSCVFVFVVITAVVYRNIWYVRYWIYKVKKQPGRRRSARRRGNASESDPLIGIHDEVQRDVFVINHDKDDKFVLTDLQGILETQMGYTSCIYTRNCCNGAKLDLMVEGIYSSMHTLAVISKHFLKDPWCMFQLDVAFDRRVREKRSSMLFVILDDIDFQSLNKYWCVLLTKTPTARWCPTRSDIRRKLFEEQIEKQLGVPMGKRYCRTLSAP